MGGLVAVVSLLGGAPVLLRRHHPILDLLFILFVAAFFGVAAVDWGRRLPQELPEHRWVTGARDIVILLVLLGLSVVMGWWSIVAILEILRSGHAKRRSTRL